MNQRTAKDYGYPTTIRDVKAAENDGDRDKKTLLIQKGLICVVELKGLEPLTSTMPL
jgi:hypothetical protein